MSRARSNQAVLAFAIALIVSICGRVAGAPGDKDSRIFWTERRPIAPPCDSGGPGWFRTYGQDTRGDGRRYQGASVTLPDSAAAYQAASRRARGDLANIIRMSVQRVLYSYLEQWSRSQDRESNKAFADSTVFQVDRAVSITASIWKSEDCSETDAGGNDQHYAFVVVGTDLSKMINSIWSAVEARLAMPERSDGGSNSEVFEQKVREALGVSVESPRSNSGGDHGTDLGRLEEERRAERERLAEADRLAEEQTGSARTAPRGQRVNKKALAGGKLHFDQATRLQDPIERATRFRRARDTFREVVQGSPSSGEARRWLGQTYAELGQPDSAVYWLADAVTTDSREEKDVQQVRDHYWSLLHNEGLASAKAAMEADRGENKPLADGLYRRSLAEFREAMAYAPERPDTHRDRGVAFVNLGMVDSALVAFATAQKYAPNDPKIHSFRIAVMRREGDRLRDAAGKKARIPDTTGAVWDYKAAQRYFQQTLDLKPSDADLVFYLNWNLGVTSFELSNLIPAERPTLLQAAIDYYQRVLTDDPTYLDVLYNIFIIHKDRGDSKPALEIAKRMVDLRPKDPTYWGLYGTAQRLAKNDERVYGPTAIREALSKRGEVVDPAQAQGRATAAGPVSDLMRRFRENGAPDEIRAFKDLQGVELENWFYWTRGTAYGFSGGAERYAETFAPAGTLSVENAKIVDRNGAKFITGTVANTGNYAYHYCRVEFNLLDDTGQVGWASSSVDKLDPKGKWSFKIPLTGNGAKATRIETPDPAHPASGL